MIICTKCGSQNREVDDFCGSCGSYLGFSGQRVEEPVPEPEPEAVQEPAAEAEHHGLLDRVREVVGLGEGRPAGQPTDASSAEEGAAPAADGSAGAMGSAAAAEAEAATVAAQPATVVVSSPKIFRVSEPEPEPEPALAPEPEPEPEPALAPEPEPEPEPEPAPAPEPAPVAMSEPAPAVQAPAPPAPKPAGPIPKPPTPLIRPAVPGAGGPARRPLVEVARPAAVPAAPVVPPVVPPATVPLSPPAPTPPASAQPAAARPAVAAQPAATKPGPRKPAEPPAVHPAPAAAPPTATVAGGEVPAAPAQPASRQPAAIQPAAPIARPAPKPTQAETPPPNPGDLICGSCGIGNDPNRRFCRRCGTSLAEATVATVRVPWWRRIFGSRQRKPVAAGERPKSMQPGGSAGRTGFGGRRLLSRIVQVVIMAVIVGGVVGYAAIPGLRDAVSGAFTGIRKMVAPELVPVNTAGQATGPSIKGHGPTLAFDLRSNTYWAATFDAANPPTIAATFTAPADIAKVLFTSGAADDFKSQARPQKVQVEFLGADGSVVATSVFELKDVADLQVFDAGAKQARSVRITVTDVYPSVTGKAVAITEIEFRAAQ